MRELISAERVQSRIAELAAEINDDFHGIELLYLIIVLRGGCFFGVDLAKRLAMPVRLDYIRVASYEGTNSTGTMNLVSDIKANIAGRAVLVIDDIVDTGFTMAWVLRYLELKRPALLRTAALLDKPSMRRYEVPIDYLGFTVPNVFVAGFGLDGGDDNLANIPRIVAMQDVEGEATVPARRARTPVREI